MPARGMIGAQTCSLGQDLGNILSIVLYTVRDHQAKELGNEVKSTEDMVANFNSLNNRKGLEDLVLWSCDVWLSAGQEVRRDCGQAPDED